METDQVSKSEEIIVDVDAVFFVVNDDMDVPDRFLIVRRDAKYAAHVVARFNDYDFAHVCAARLAEYVRQHDSLESDE